jgi:hypothetical protein
LTTSTVSTLPPELFNLATTSCKSIKDFVVSVVSLKIADLPSISKLKLCNDEGVGTSRKGNVDGSYSDNLLLGLRKINGGKSVDIVVVVTTVVVCVVGANEKRETEISSKVIGLASKASELVSCGGVPT